MPGRADDRLGDHRPALSTRKRIFQSDAVQGLGQGQWVGLFGDRGARLHMRRYLREARQETRELIFLAVIARMSYRKHKLPPRRMPSVRRGFRYAFRRFNPVRLCTRGIALRTLEDIQRALTDFDRVVARALARLPKSGISGRLLIRGADDLIRVHFSRPGADGVVRAPDTS